MTLKLDSISLVVQGQSHLSDISVRFEPGSFNVLLGRTLAGKTSLLRVIAGLDKPSQGQVLMNGMDMGGVRVQERNVAMVYQQFINYPNMSVFDNIASPLRIARQPENVIRSKVEEVAQLLHIEAFLKRLPNELSGGQQQRTAMARALVKESDLILFDEPLVNLDYKLREELRTELQLLLKERNTIAVYASSDPAEALALGGTVTLLHEGRAIQSGLTNEVYSHPQRIEAAELFSEPPINVISGTVTNRRITLVNGVQFPMPSGLSLSPGDYRFGLRPHHLKMKAAADDSVALDLSVDVAELSGSETFLHLSAGEISVVAHLSGVHTYHTDARTRLFFSPSELYIFDLHGNTLHTPKASLSTGGVV